jgi:hypothetical protein
MNYIDDFKVLAKHYYEKNREIAEFPHFCCSIGEESVVHRFWT